MFAINKRVSSKDKLDTVLQELREQIRSGSIRPGEYLVSEAHLAKKYHLSKTTLRKVLADLEREGLIEKIPCIGNRVREIAAERRSLKFYCYDVCYELPVYRHMIQTFQDSHPDVEIDLVPLPNASYIEQILDKLEEGEQADLVLLSDDHFNYLEDTGKTDLLCRASSANEIYPKLQHMFSVKGELKAVPIVFSPIVYCCNSSIVPDSENLKLDSWDDLLQLSKKLTKSDADGIKQQYGLAFTASPRRWLMFMHQNGGSFFGENGRPAFAEPATVEAIQFFESLIDSNLISPYMQGDFRADRFLFENSKVALLLSSYFFMNELHSLPFKWDVLPFMPSDKQKSTLLIGSGIAVPERSEHRKTALEFARHMASESSQSYLKMNACSIPANRSVAENRSIVNPSIHPKHYHSFIDLLPLAVPLKDLGVGYRLLSEIGLEMLYVWMKLDTASDTCRRVQEKLLKPVYEQSLAASSNQMG
ncbi:extracellular solute-binding protein [Paenibacillus nasutitermitis]|uniref:HTH gntR-type domain-containing protein n=1 Tax=Paenibacillus nasutitermitis TaxID=1652958 RepID=A0A916YJ05_9BACL|nr:extracellular solute-binding protein [Paenibacillus nasutitermitis]GGD47442.1 hypothetical protein GCM10010911_01180 [Paenibacillus nasutitermitis]